MRLRAGLLWFLILAAATVAGVVAFASTAPASCRNADQSLSAQLLVQAQTRYADVLKQEPQSDCAAKGMRLVVRARCQRADILERTKLTDEAGKIYLALIQADLPDWHREQHVHWDLGCAITGLARLTPTPSPPPKPTPSPAPVSMRVEIRIDHHRPFVCTPKRCRG